MSNLFLQLQSSQKGAVRDEKHAHFLGDIRHLGIQQPPMDTMPIRVPATAEDNVLSATIRPSVERERYMVDVSRSNVKIDDGWDQKETVVVYVMTEVAVKVDGIWDRLGAAEQTYETVVLYVMTEVAAKGSGILYRLVGAEETYGPIHRPIRWLAGFMEGVAREETRTEVESVDCPGRVSKIQKNYSGRRTY